MTRRERWGVMGAILVALDQEAGRGSQGRMTNVAARANIAYDRLHTYVEELQEGGLLTRDRIPTLTPRGREFLRHYRDWLAVLERFGLQAEPPARASPPLSWASAQREG